MVILSHVIFLIDDPNLVPFEFFLNDFSYYLISTLVYFGGSYYTVPVLFEFLYGKLIPIFVSPLLFFFFCLIVILFFFAAVTDCSRKYRNYLFLLSPFLFETFPVYLPPSPLPSIKASKGFLTFTLSFISRQGGHPTPNVPIRGVFQLTGKDSLVYFLLFFLLSQIFSLRVYDRALC